VRLQCHEGIDLAQAAYEWNYGRQLMAIRLHDGQTGGIKESDVFSRDFLLERPLLKAISQDGPCVLLIDEIDRAVTALEAVGFTADRHEWSVNFRGRSQVSLQLSTEDFYRDFTSRAVPADVHGILLRVASLEDTLAGKIKAWRTPERRPSKAIKDLGDIARLIEAHPELTATLPPDVSHALSR
jgi:hypothetical protein